MDWLIFLAGVVVLSLILWATIKHALRNPLRGLRAIKSGTCVYCKESFPFSDWLITENSTRQYYRRLRIGPERYRVLTETTWECPICSETTTVESVVDPFVWDT